MRLGEAPQQPTAALVALVEDAMSARATSWRKPHTGLTPAQRFVVQFENGDSCFVKASVDAATERMLRTEHRMLAIVDPDLVPATRAWIDNGAESLLITENLHDAYWPADHVRPDGQPVRYEDGQIELLLAALDRVAATPADGLPDFAERFAPQWPRIAADPKAFLSLGLCTNEWFERSIDQLIAAEAEVSLDGDALVHNDVRSDNVCFRGDRVVLVDWSDPRRGPAWFDRATLALTLPLESDVSAAAIAPDASAFAVWQAGVLARRAVEDVAAAPAWLIDVFKRMARIALEWARETRGLSPL